MSNNKILVLGGNGFIGSHLVDALVKEECSVKVFDRPNTTILNNVVRPNVQMIEGDITSDADMAAAVSGCDICFHLVSTVLPKSSNQDPAFDIETNLLGTIRLLNYAVKAGIKKIIFLSSGGTVYGVPMRLPINEEHPTNPICSYGISKLAIEKYLHLYYQLYGIDYTVLRLSNPYGERQRTLSTQGAVAVFLGKALRNEIVEVWGDGSVVRDYIHVSDVVSAMLKSISYNGSNRVLNIGSGFGMSVNNILDEIECVIGAKVVRQYTKGRTFDVPSSVLAIDRAMTVLKWKPQVPFLEGVQRMVSWLESERLLSNK